MSFNHLFKSFHSFSYSGGKISPETNDLIVETPIEIIINQKRRLLIMFTPERVKELVVGFVFTEGLIENVGEIEECVISSVLNGRGEQVLEARVRIPSHRMGMVQQENKGRVSYSSCGICGTDNYYNLGTGIGRVKSRHQFSMDLLQAFPRRLKAFQPLYNRTGGAHAAVLADSEGNSVFHCEDMGRHNALDKVIGCALINEIACDDKILFSSGRASLEMILKTARVGIPVFVAMSRPTSRAVEAAKFYNITLVDVAKGGNRIYSHVRRIKGF
ncbi:MAG: formate dehydrogenase accessory sulfurtransferase FdhD [Desulfatiglans sp.]|nr:formate dehydrogenase accessory sulfurtransferase FdhD [Thermodesulfobacteriota bacterium]MEE4351463.1 formate dehydrogenase accessory sulfurtransferase FdhD [Desulfatiglans sp.]